MDLLICDPPFGIGEEDFGSNYKRNDDLVVEGYVSAPSGKDYYPWSLNWLKQAHRVLKPKGALYVVIGWQNSHHLMLALEDAGFSIINEIIWHRNFPVPNKYRFNTAHYNVYYCCKEGINHKELCFNSEANFFKDDNNFLELERSPHYADMSSVWSIPQEFQKGPEKRNKNKLAEDFVSKMIRYSSNIDDVVCDFFLGGGTTAIVAHKLARRVCGFELNPASYKLVCERMENTQKYGSPDVLGHKKKMPGYQTHFEHMKKRYIPNFKS